MSLLKVQGNISGTGSVTLASPNTSNNITLVLPTTVGTANQALVTDGSGNLSFSSTPAGPVTAGQSVVYAMVFGV